MAKVCIGIDYDSHAIHMFQVVFPFNPRQLGETHRQNLTGDLGDDFSKLVDLFTMMRNTAATLGDELFVFVEAPLHIQNAKTTFKLHQVFTIITLACDVSKVLWDKIEVTRWKKAVLQNARAKKEEVIEAMQQLFGKIVSDTHFADAAAIALAGLKMTEETCPESFVMSKIATISRSSQSLTSLQDTEEKPQTGTDT